MWKTIAARLCLLTVVMGLVLIPRGVAAARDPETKQVVGPATEKRFPPLQIPKGFKATLFACDPLVEYPSVISLGPKPGTLFVAHDYVTGLGVKIVRRDEVRLLADSDGDGYADKSTVYAGGFNSIQGLAYRDGTVFVMHAPFLTALKDTNGDGRADERRNIVTGLGLKPENNPNRLHCANGVVAAHDGWLYLALGDRGCDVKRPEGDRLLFQQGGILRCRPDGRDLHVFSGGLRNIYDIALDDELNVFVRDNENDGGDYMIRVCHSFFGADHGYPYLYDERPDEAMSPLADLGRGSSAGGTSYLETTFPKEYRESLFYCEWGRAVVLYHKRRSRTDFAPMTEVDFAAAADNDPYGFKPTDLVVDYDGSMLISDWGDGQRPKRGRGRIYRIVHAGAPAGPHVALSKLRQSDLPSLINMLGSTSYHTRDAAQLEIQRRGKPAAAAIRKALQGQRLNVHGRMHAVWILSQVAAGDATADFFSIAEGTGDARVNVQAVRALADLYDPVLARHRLAARRGDEAIASRLAKLITRHQDPRVVLNVYVALARLRWKSAPGWLQQQKIAYDKQSALGHAAQQLLRSADNWPAVLKLTDEPATEIVKRDNKRSVALRALADQPRKVVVDGLIARLNTEPVAQRRREYIDLLARVCHKPAPWTYWGFRPAPRPANTIAWERTKQITGALDRALADTDMPVRVFALKRMRREKVPIRLNTLAAWLRKENRAEHVSAILSALNDFKPLEVRNLLEEVVRRKDLSVAPRLEALVSFAANIDAGMQNRLYNVAKSLDDGPVLAALLRDLGHRKAIRCGDYLLAKLGSRSAAVRAAAIAALGDRGEEAAASRVVNLLKDTDPRVRRAAATAAGQLNVIGAAEQLRAAAASRDHELCRAALISLKQLLQPGAVPQAVAALKHPVTQLPALAYLAEFGNEKQTSDLARLAASNRSIDVTQAIVRAYANWLRRDGDNTAAKTRLRLESAIAGVHGNIGVVLHWRARMPLTKGRISALQKDWVESSLAAKRLEFNGCQSVIGSGTDGVVRLLPPADRGKSTRFVWLATADVIVSEPTRVEFFTGSDGSQTIWLNAKSIFSNSKPSAYRANANQFQAQLVKGTNRLVVRVEGSRPDVRFHLRFRAVSSHAEHERLIAAALRGQGSALRGRKIFLAAKKSQCVNCHRLNEKGGRIGPDLTGIGSRFSRIHLIESILQPSRTIAPSYATTVVALSSGRIVTGVKVAETAKSITLGDNQGKLHTFARDDIEQTRHQSKSTMPEGLEKRLTEREFVDLLAFLQSLKKRPPGTTQPKR